MVTETGRSRGAAEETPPSPRPPIEGESVNEPGFRERLVIGRGFCRAHAREVLEADRARSIRTHAADREIATRAFARLQETE